MHILAQSTQTTSSRSHTTILRVRSTVSRSSSLHLSFLSPARPASARRRLGKQNNLQNDIWRLQHLTGFLSNPAHPHHKFSTGNIDTLETIPNANNINVRDRLIQFHETFYSANLMKLVLLGRQDLDTLQDWATQYFCPSKQNVARPVYTMPRLTPAHFGECARPARQKYPQAHS